MRLAEVQGRSFEPDGFVLGDGLSVANYAKALSIDEPLYRSADEARVAGWPGRPVPPGMLAFFLAFPDPGVWDELGVTWGRTLAGTIEIEAARLAGEEEFVEGRAHVEAVWERPGRDGDARQFLRLRSDFTDEKGEFVGRWRVTFVERAGGPPSGSVPQEDPGGGGEELPLERLAPRSAPPAGAQAGTDLPAHRTAPPPRLRPHVGGPRRPEPRPPRRGGGGRGRIPVGDRLRRLRRRGAGRGRPALGRRRPRRAGYHPPAAAAVAGDGADRPRLGHGARAAQRPA